MNSRIKNTKAYKSLCTALKPYINEFQLVGLGYSGGQDSELMAACLSVFAQEHQNIRCVLLHVNHGISANALNWQKHCLLRSAVYNLEIELTHLRITQQKRKSLEAQAREGRYHFFKSFLPQKSILLTAHHADDQLETILLALKRGSGQRGLSGIHQQGKLAEQKICLRPFLDIEQHEIETEVRDLCLPFINDESNQDTRFDRNYLRHHSIPELKQRWPSLAKTAVRSASLLLQEQEAMSNLLELQLEQLEVSKNTFLFQPIKQYRPSLQASLIRHILQINQIEPPSMVRFNEIMKQIIDIRVDSQVHIELGHLVIKRYQNHLYFVDQSSLKPVNNFVICARDLKKTKMAYGDYCLEAKPKTSETLGWPDHIFEQNIEVRFDMPLNFRCNPALKKNSQTLKQMFQENQIPPWERHKVPLIFLDSVLVGAPGVWIEKGFLDNSAGWSILYRHLNS